ncbi:MAG: ATP-binding protein [Actinomycetia bacterium]|nr:ATP-binding protein [Actinomycetes bacterium]MCP5034527.1 ATP-binding protein [Actinomycetes bacterium]
MVAVSAQPLPLPSPISAKIVISGGFGVGKTTLVSTISEITPLRTEANMTTASVGVDDRELLRKKTSTTVALDFGRVTISETLRLYLFGTPGQERFGFMWDDLVRGALGALILTDTRRLEACHESIDYYETKAIPFVVAVNQFEDGPVHRLDQVRAALDLDSATPLVRFDAREKESVKEVLINLLDLLLARTRPVNA